MGGEKEETHQVPQVSYFQHKKNEEANFCFISTSSHPTPRDLKAASLAQTSWSCRVPPAPWASLPGAAPVRTSNPAWHRITRPASLGFPAAVLAPPSWPGPGEAGQLQESSEAIRSFVQWRQEGTYQRSKSVLLSTQEKEKSALNGSQEHLLGQGRPRKRFYLQN